MSHALNAIQKFSSSVVFFVVSSTSGSTMAKVLLYIRLYIYKGRNPADDFFFATEEHASAHLGPADRKNT